MDKVKKVIISFLILSCYIFIFNLKTYAHWINATHEYMNDLAVWHLCRLGGSKFTYESTICRILNIWEDFRGKKLMYRMIVEQGVKDADLRVNGIYAVDGHCKDPANETCPEGEKIYNDIPEWIIGDHGYNPENGKGFYSNPEDNFLDERINELLKNFHDPKTERLKEALGCQKNDRTCFINRLRSIAQKSNAATMAKFFWERAINEWKMGHEAEAMYNLGIAIHLVQDMTVPHHVRLIRDRTHHEYYEDYVWKTYLRNGNFEPKIEFTHEKLTAEEWIKRNAKETYRLNLSPKVSSADSVRLAIRSTIGVITNFFELVLPKLPEPRLRIRKDGTMYVNQDQAKMEILHDILKKAFLNVSVKKLYLRPNRDLEWGNMVDIFEIVKNAGIEDVIISIAEKWWRERIRDVKLPTMAHIQRPGTKTRTRIKPMRSTTRIKSGQFVAPIEIPEDILGPIVLTLHKDMKADINQTYYEFNNVQKELICIYSGRQDKTIFIRAEARIPISKIIELIDIAKKAGVETIGIIPEYFRESREELDEKTEKEAEVIGHEEETKEVWVMPRVIGKLKEGLYIGKRVFPPKVKIKGPASKIENVCLVETTPIDISSWTKSRNVEADIILPFPNIKFASAQIKATVSIIIIAKGTLPPVRAVGNIKPPKLIKEVRPVYPNIAREAGVEGVVILEVITDISGRVQKAKVLRSIPLLDQAAIDAVRQWIYKPMIIDGKPRGVIFTVTVTFGLK